MTEKHDLEPDMARWPRKQPIEVPVGKPRTEMDLPNPPIENTQVGRLKRPIAGSVLQKMPDGTMRRWNWKKGK